jgi:hypothetical protein
LVASEPAYVVGTGDDPHRPVQRDRLGQPYRGAAADRDDDVDTGPVGGTGGPLRQRFGDVLGHLGPAQRGPAGQRVHQHRMPLAADHHDRTRLQPVELRADPRDRATRVEHDPLPQRPMREPHLSPPRRTRPTPTSTLSACRPAPRI